MRQRFKRPFIYYALGVLTILVGAIFLLVYVLTILLNQHKPFFEHELSEILHSPVKIEKVEASYHGLSTHIALENVSVMNEKTHQSLFHFDRLYIKFNPIQYLFLGGSFKSSQFELLGADVVIEQKRSGDIYFQQFLLPVQNWKWSHAASDDIMQSPIMDWLMEESHLALKEINFKFQQNRKTIASLHFIRLDLMNSENGHVLTGEIRLGSDDHTDVQFYLFINHPKPVWVKGFLDFHDVRLMEWMPFLQKMIPTIKTLEGTLNGRIWWEWEEGDWKSIKGKLQAESVNIQGGNHRLTTDIRLDRASGEWGWTKTPLGWIFGCDHILLKTQHYLWPENQVFLGVENKKPTSSKQALWIKYLSVQDVLNLLRTNSWLISKLDSVPLGVWLDKDLGGDLNEITIQHEGPRMRKGAYRINAGFSNVHIPAIASSPEISGLSGAVTFNRDEGRVMLDSKNTLFNFGSLFPQPLFFHQLKSQLHWKLSDDHRWWAAIESANFINAEAALNVEGEIENDPKASSPVMRILAGGTVENANQIKHYFPVGIFKPDLISWLNQAFVNSPPLTATAIIQGAIHDFPFDQNSGTFTVDIPVKNLDFQYAPDWPVIYGFNGHLVFSGRSMLSEANSGKVAGASISSAKGSIPYIGEDKPLILNIEGQANGDAQTLLDFYHYSPLREWSRANLTGIGLSGPSSLHLSMMLPIETPEETTVKGLLNWNKVGLHIKPWALDVRDLTGHIGFTEKDISSTDLMGSWMGQTLPISIQTVAQNHQPVTQIRFSGQLSSMFLQQRWAKRFPFLSGSLPFQALYEWHLSKKDSASDHVAISSHLKGTRISLPPPFGKTADEIWPSVEASVYFGQSPDDQKVMVTAKNRWSLGLWIRHNAIWSGHLSVGDGEAAAKTEKGWWIDGVLSQFNWNQWKPYLDKTTATVSEALMKQLKGLNLWVEHAELGGREFDQTRVQLFPYASQWLCTLSGKNMEGRIWFNWPLNHHLITAEFKHLYLSPSKEKKAMVDVSRIPPLKISVGNFYYKNHSYGQLNLETHTEGHRLDVDHLNLADSLMNASLKGYWEQDSHDLNKNRSGLSGEWGTEHLTRLMESTGMDFGLKGTHAYAAIELSWPSPLNDIVWTDMRGYLDLKLGKGQIIAGAKNSSAMLNAGFIISLLSMRRIINMDFSDIGQQGYSFDMMRGRLLLDGNGIMKMEGLYFDGPIAKIYVSGRAYLIKKLLDLNVIVMPYVTSSLPLLATITAGPIAGGITFVADKLFGKEVSKMTQYVYKVKGPWSQPKFEEKVSTT